MHRAPGNTGPCIGRRWIFALRVGLSVGAIIRAVRRSDVERSKQRCSTQRHPVDRHSDCPFTIRPDTGQSHKVCSGSRWALRPTRARNDRARVPPRENFLAQSPFNNQQAAWLSASMRSPWLFASRRRERAVLDDSTTKLAHVRQVNHTARTSLGTNQFAGRPNPWPNRNTADPARVVQVVVFAGGHFNVLATRCNGFGQRLTTSNTGRLWLASLARK